ncbi:MAG: Arc family DNA binding domain-containing protein [Verrucomicrobiales bacterium]|nr:Arc family DNA binding domain-containing protein [Verrucomicrobiales bacterium]
MAERKSFLLRIDPQLWSELESWAEAELRSVNGQIEYLLREAVQRRRSRRVPGVSTPPASAEGPTEN